MNITKVEIIEACRNEIESRIKNSQDAIKSAQESANSEQKSTAGDKHDTARSMAQFEQEKLSKQLAEQLKLRALLSNIPETENHEKVKLGSLVECTNGHFFLGIGIGKLEIRNQQIFAISAASPLGKKLLGASAGKEFTINSRNFKVVSVC